MMRRSLLVVAGTAVASSAAVGFEAPREDGAGDAAAVSDDTNLLSFDVASDDIHLLALGRNFGDSISALFSAVVAPIKDEASGMLKDEVSGLLGLERTPPRTLQLMDGHAAPEKLSDASGSEAPMATVPESMAEESMVEAALEPAVEPILEAAVDAAGEPAVAVPPLEQIEQERVEKEIEQAAAEDAAEEDTEDGDDDEEPDNPIENGLDGEEPDNPIEDGLDGEEPDNPIEDGLDGEEPDNPIEDGLDSGEEPTDDSTMDAAENAEPPVKSEASIIEPVAQPDEPVGSAEPLTVPQEPVVKSEASTAEPVTAPEEPVTVIVTKTAPEEPVTVVVTVPKTAPEEPVTVVVTVPVTEPKAEAVVPEGAKEGKGGGGDEVILAKKSKEKVVERDVDVFAMMGDTGDDDDNYWDMPTQMLGTGSRKANATNPYPGLRIPNW